MKTNIFISTFMCIFAILLVQNMYSQSCTQCDNTGNPPGNYASEIGQGTTASGSYSFAGGVNSTASGGVSFAFGSSALASDPYSISLGALTSAESSNAVAMGSFNKASGTNSFVLGNGQSSSSILENNIAYSMMIGFNSNKHTLFVGPSPGNGYTGSIGIGDVTDPQAKLHIKGDDNEQADILLDPATLKYAKLKFGETAPNSSPNRIEAKPDSDLNFYTASDFVFWDSNIGVGIHNPTEKLQVNGNIKSTGFILENGQQAANRILQSDANGLASWVDPMTLSVDDGDWTIAGDNLFRLSGNVGIGTTSPNHKLEVAGTIKTNGFRLTDGNQASGYILQSDANGNASWVEMPDNDDGDWEIDGSDIIRGVGNVGIGMDPIEKLDIFGNLRVHNVIKGNSSGSSSKLEIKGSENSNSAVIELWKGVNANERSLKLATYIDGNIEFRTNGKMRMNMYADDKMVIGTGSDNYNMEVNGKIDAEEVEVHMGNWWDEVFDADYQLMPLSDVEEYINNNGHLPDLPSEEEVLENGIDLGEMNALLLKKIEELTLHVIELEKRIQD